MSNDESNVYGGHSLRVGGNNFMRHLNIDPDVHRALGDWAVLKSERDYMQLAPTEQFTLTHKLAVQRTRDEAFAGQTEARAALPRLLRLSVQG